jgi:hypothetical protein
VSNPNPFENDPEILDGYIDGNDLLGWEDDTPLLPWGYLDPSLPGQLDPSSDVFGGPVGERIYLISGTLFKDWSVQASPTSAGSTPAIANYPIAGFPFGATLGSSGTMQLQCANVDFITKINDPDSPSTFWDGRLIDPGSISLSLALTPTGDAAIQVTIGSVVMDNSDGAFDTALDIHSVVSQSLAIRGGRAGSWLENFVTIFHARVTGIGMTETELTIELQDPVLYAQNIYPTSIYTGLGGASGDAELEGVVKPVVIGRVWNMSPILINATQLIFQVHDGAISAVTGVFDGGVPLNFSANYASYAALATASVSPGLYATCIAAGLIKVGGTPAFALTAHIDGAGAAGITCRSIATWLVGQLESQLNLNVDYASFSALPLWTAGWVWNETFTFSDAISRFVGDAGYHWGADADGTVRALQLSPPNPDAVVRIYRTEDIMRLERAPLPHGYEGLHHRRRVRFGRNWTPQDDSSLAATAVQRAGRQREWRTVIKTVSTISRNTIDPSEVETSLNNLVHSTLLADHLLLLHGASRKMFSLETRVFGNIPKIGSTVQVIYPRFGLAGGQLFRVVAVDMRLRESVINMLLWG